MAKANTLSLGLIILTISVASSIAWVKSVQSKTVVQAEEKVAEAGEIAENSALDKLREKREKLQEAIAILESAPKVPLLENKTLQTELTQFRSQLASIQEKLEPEDRAKANLEAAKRVAMEAAVMVQNPPHPINVWYEAKQKWQQSISLLDQVPEGTSSFAEAYRKLENYRANSAVISKKFELATQAVELNNQGNKKIEKEDYKGAIADLNRAIKLNPGQSETYLTLGFVYSEMGNKELAIATYNKAIEVNPKSAIAYYYRGDEYLELEDKEKALQDYNRAINVDPNYANAYFDRGAVRYLLGDEETAIDDFEKAAELFGKNGDVDSQQLALELVERFYESDSTAETTYMESPEEDTIEYREKPVIIYRDRIKYRSYPRRSRSRRRRR